jgi:predicted  nucleic acid-binding Zn-ribbon protein
MSDTRRTDACIEYDDTNIDDVKNFARQLERELNAANQRIKRLEEAGNQLKDRYILENENWDLKTVNDWNKAKEANP